MKWALVANRYAGGLAKAIDDGELESIAEALRRFSDLMRDSDGLRNTLLNPALNLSRRKEILDGVLASDSLSGFPEPAARLLHLMLTRGRLKILDDVAEAFEQKVDQRLNRIEATLITAVPLPDDLREEIREALAAYTGKTVRVDCYTDASIIDGVIARIEGLVIDGSVRTQLERLKQSMLEKEIEIDESASD